MSNLEKKISYFYTKILVIICICIIFIILIAKLVNSYVLLENRILDNKDDTASHDEHLKSQDFTVVIYGKDACIYCLKAIQFLINNNIKYQKIDISTNYDLYTKLVDKTHQKTVPFIFVDGEFLGGYSQLIECKKILEYINDI